MVILGFGMNLMMLPILTIAKALPPSPFWEIPQMGLGYEELEAAFTATFYFPGLLLFASMLAYLVAQLFDVRLYHFWWRVTAGRHMWVRNNGSTMISQLVDTIIVNGIYLHFGLQFDWATTWSIIVAVYFCKLILAVVDTPLIYLGRHWLERFLGIDQSRVRAGAPLA